MNISRRSGSGGGASSSQPAGSTSPWNDAMPCQFSLRRTNSTSQPPCGAAPDGSGSSLRPSGSRITTGSQPFTARLNAQYGDAAPNNTVGAGPR